MIAQRTPAPTFECRDWPDCGCPDGTVDPSCPELQRRDALRISPGFGLPNGARPGTFAEMGGHAGEEAEPYRPLDRSPFWATVLVGSIIALGAIGATAWIWLYGGRTLS